MLFGFQYFLCPYKSSFMEKRRQRKTGGKRLMEAETQRESERKRWRNKERQKQREAASE